MSKLLQDKVALITGASRGIGAAVARRFAREGAHIIITARTISGLEAVDDYAKKHGSSATIVPLDLKEYDKIDELGYLLSKRFGKLDILVGNAAILGGLSPITHVKPKTWDEVLNVNVTANWRLIRSMDLLLRSSDNGRAIFVTSDIVQHPTAYWGPYAVSKSALETMVKTYAEEMTTTNVKVNLIDPGVVATKLRNQAMPGENQENLVQPDHVTDIFVKLASNNCHSNGKLFQFCEHDILNCA